MLLNTYLGVMRDDAAVSLTRAEATFEAALEDLDRRRLAGLTTKRETERRTVMLSENRNRLAFRRSNRQSRERRG